MDEVESLPAGIAHGDACNRNLMISASRPELVMIDFGFLRYAPLGLDLGQLILGEVQTGARPADDLESAWSACLSATSRECARRAMRLNCPASVEPALAAWPSSTASQRYRSRIWNGRRMRAWMRCARTGQGCADSLLTDWTRRAARRQPEPWLVRCATTSLVHRS